ncbi:alpha/beta hydrolase-fold protein [Aurantibacter sp.]|uniref:alpha/beta hydrolase n=1 Tax=Aurantibacter sp. TaxID=2807103 RepID=UPI003263731C
MKKLFLGVLFIATFNFGLSQESKGKVVFSQLYSAALENPGGEDPTRKLTIYLPPGYENRNKNYPVLYYLNGFTGTGERAIAYHHFDKLMDKAIATGKIKPVIVVMSNQYTLFRGSLYTNSSLTGNWSDFTAKDVVTFIDENYRTIKDAKSRGIVGYSMGGYGAIKIGMLHPEVFSLVYSMSGAFDLVKEMGAKGQAFKRIQEISTREELVDAYNEFVPNFFVAVGRAFSPNPNKPPFFANLPYSYEADSLIIDYDTKDLWNKHMLHVMADEYIENLKKLKAIKIDWGRNDEFDFVIMGCKTFSQKLENLGIEHLAEEYIGTHGNKIWTEDGRVLNDMLPFFDTYLTFKKE